MSTPIGPANRPSGAGVMTCMAWRHIAGALKLSARELEIIRGVFDNQTESALAENLGISGHTAHSHMNRIFRKLNVSTRTQMVVVVMGEMLALTRTGGNCLPPICANYSKGLCPLRNRH